jgi:hypothetical protein
LWAHKDHPNPFTEKTNIDFHLTTQSGVCLDIFNALGLLISNVIDAEIQAGNHYVEWDAAHLEAGIYYLELKIHSSAGKQLRYVEKMLLC